MTVYNVTVCYMMLYVLVYSRLPWYQHHYVLLNEAYVERKCEQTMATCGQHVAECGCMLQHVAACGNIWQNVAEGGNVWQQVAKYNIVDDRMYVLCSKCDSITRC